MALVLGASEAAGVVMRSKIASWFHGSAGVLLVITALGKLVSAFGSAHILQLPDPIIPLPYRWLMGLAGVMELLVAGICFSKKDVAFKSGAVAWLAAIFLIYRLGLHWGHYYAPCKCLGNLTDALQISPETADLVAKIIMFYLLGGSFTILINNWWLKSKTAPVSPPNSPIIDPK